MPRRISLSQLRSKQRQAINQYNQAVRKYNQDLKRAVDNYNREVRAHNARVRANQQRIRAALNKLRSQPVTMHYTVYQRSVYTLHERYVRLEEVASAQQDPRYEAFLTLSEQENANSLEMMNALLHLSDQEDDISNEEIQTTVITDELKSIATDLDNRWRGAIYSLHPRNPDAARHFCTSVREVFTQILEIKAPDADVLAVFPTCETTNHGNPTRRAKIKYFLHQKGMTLDALEDFIDENIENVLQLFRIFNEGTHGSSGKYSLRELSALKKRSEDGILYLAALVN